MSSLKDMNYYVDGAEFANDEVYIVIRHREVGKGFHCIQNSLVIVESDRLLEASNYVSEASIESYLLHYAGALGVREEG